MMTGQSTMRWMAAALTMVMCAGAAFAGAAVAPVAYDQKFTALGGIANQFRPYFVDPDSTTGYSFSLVSGPSHGSVVFSGTSTYNYFMAYTPTGGYTGTDSWTWKVNDGSADSNTVTCSVLVRTKGTTGGRTVLIVVKSTIQPVISAELTQLQNDLIACGYAAEIFSTNAGDAATLWNTLKTQYNQPGRFLAGVILVGQLPFADNASTGEATDYVYMNMEQYQQVTYCNFHIWAGRMWALSETGSTLMFGDEATLIKRVLLANHEYRRGISGLPYNSYNIDTAYSLDYHLNALDIWPTVEVLRPYLAFPKTGDFMEEQSHGEVHGYDNNKVGTWTIHDYLNQIRHVICCSCDSGRPGGVVNQQIFTRRGGNVMSIGATQTSYSGMIMMLDNSTTDQNYRQLLNDGDTFGDALLVYQPFTDVYRLVFYGDPSMKPMQASSNQIPVVNTLTASATSGQAPLTVDFNATASDADGTVDVYEWFPVGHQMGRVNPYVTGRTNVRHIFDKPHRYLARVQAIDNKHAVGYKEVAIAVAPKNGQPIRINCGECWSYKFATKDYYKEGLDWRDSQNKLWLHDQQWVSGSWGWQGPDTSNYWTGDVLGTVDDKLFLSYHWDYGGGGITYKIPVANGTYTVNLGFADMESTGAGDRLMNVTAEGAAWLTNYDIYADAGAKTAIFKTSSVTVSDGELTLLFITVGGSTRPALINCIEVIPPVGDNKEPVAKINASPTSGSLPLNVSFTSTGSSDPDGTISSYSWDFGDGNTGTGVSTSHTYSTGGIYSALLTVTDNKGGVASDHVTITVTSGGNTPPVASNQEVTTNYQTAVAVTLSATDGDGDPLTYTKLSDPVHGTLTGTIPNYTYTPNTGFHGDDSFTWKANDGHVDSNTATFTIHVLDAGSTTTVTLDAMQDTFLDVLQPTLAHNSHNYGIHIDSYTSPNEVSHGMIQFDLSGVPAGSTITSATMKLFCFRAVGVGGATDTIVIIRCDNTWAEATATWNSDSTNGTVSYGSVLVPTFPTSPDINPPVELDFDLTALVQEWVDGTHPNRGMRLWGNQHSLDTRWVDSEDTLAKGDIYKPKLVVTYGGGGPGPDTTPPTVTMSSAVLSGTVSDNATCPVTVNVAGTPVAVTVVGLNGTWGPSPNVTLTGSTTIIAVTAADAASNTRTVNVQVTK